MIAALRSAIEKIPTREERLGGQTFKYVKLSEVLDLVDTFRNTHEPLERRCDGAFVDQLAREGCTCPVHQVFDRGHLSGCPASRGASPADLVGALQDVVHTDPGPVRAAHAVRDASSGNGYVCPNCANAGCSDCDPTLRAL